MSNIAFYGYSHFVPLIIVTRQKYIYPDTEKARLYMDGINEKRK